MIRQLPAGLTDGVYRWGSGAHVVVVVLDPAEAEALGHALGPNDTGGQELIEWANKARDAEREIENASG